MIILNTCAGSAVNRKMINYDFSRKSTVEEIQATFDQGVERFSNLEKGHQAVLDSVLIMELIASAARSTTPHAARVLDIGCGAGNYTLKLLEYLLDLDCTLLDLSRPMLERAEARIREKTAGEVSLLHGDVRAIEFGNECFDIVVTGSALHHLREDQEWEAVFTKVFKSLKSGGSFWISDLVAHENHGIQNLMGDRYGHYLEAQGGASYKDRVFRNIEEEDTPRSVSYQMNLLQSVGFVNIDILHKNACFAAFGGMKGER